MSVQAYADEKIFLCGDSDIDGSVTVTDATVIQMYRAKLRLLPFKGEQLGDVDKDGMVSVIDATYIQMYLTKMKYPESINTPVKPRVMEFENGSAKQIVKYSDPYDKNYNNSNSDIIRFTVYVETDYDTDLDGKPDLVKVWIQLPRAAAQGDYKAPVIFEASPYCAGTGLSMFTRLDEAFDEKVIKEMPQKRIPEGYASTEELSAKAKVEDWYYYFDSDKGGESFYSNYKSFDYFLVRGFALVGCAGLGTRGSQGIETCGSIMERDAFRSVIEWLHGDRNAYTGISGNIKVEADWSSKKIGMAGHSYTATMAYEVATTGVEGLETVVSSAGISSWYDYSNSQGTPTYVNYDYTTFLSDYCASRLFEHYDDFTLDLYRKWKNFAYSQQRGLAGDYGPYWEDRDYSKADNIKASALIVHGLNDDNVKTKQFELMWDAFERSGAEHKALLHQNDHITPASEDDQTDIMVGDITYKELLNRWFSHYLAGIDNDIENIPDVLCQSNADGLFYGYDSWNSYDSQNENGSLVMRPDSTDETSTVSAKGAHETNRELLKSAFNGKSSDNTSVFTYEVTTPVMINGTAKIRLCLKTDNIDAENTTVAAALVDHCEKSFMAFDPNGFDLEYTEIGTSVQGEGLEPFKLVRWNQSEVTRKIISTGIMDLKNPDAHFVPSTSVKADEQVSSENWYTYDLYLQPNMYTVGSGHTLELYILPYINGTYDDYILNIFSEEYLEMRGIRLEETVIHKHDYSFMIDNSKSFAVIPLDPTDSGK